MVKKNYVAICSKLSDKMARLPGLYPDGEKYYFELNMSGKNSLGLCTNVGLHAFCV